MYNEKLKEISKYLGIINGYEYYEIDEYIFRFMDYEDDEYVQYHKSLIFSIIGREVNIFIIK